MNFFKALLPGISWAILIFYLSVVHPASLHLPSFWDKYQLDKFSHATFYFILVFLLANGFQKQDKIKFALLHAAASAITFGIIYGGLIELCQAYFTIDRTGDWFDFIANSIGGYIGMQIFLKWKTKKQFISN